MKSFQESLGKTGSGIDELKIVAQMGSTMSVIQGIKQNVGVSVLSTISVTEELSAGTLKALTVDGLNLTRGFYLTRHKLRSLSPLGEAFFGFLKEQQADV